MPIVEFFIAMDGSTDHQGGKRSQPQKILKSLYDIIDPRQKIGHA